MSRHFLSPIPLLASVEDRRVGNVPRHFLTRAVRETFHPRAYASTVTAGDAETGAVRQTFAYHNYLPATVLYATAVDCARHTPCRNTDGRQSYDMPETECIDLS